MDSSSKSKDWREFSPYPSQRRQSAFVFLCSWLPRDAFCVLGSSFCLRAWFPGRRRLAWGRWGDEVSGVRERLDARLRVVGSLV